MIKTHMLILDEKVWKIKQRNRHFNYKLFYSDYTTEALTYIIQVACHVRFQQLIRFDMHMQQKDIVMHSKTYTQETKCSVSTRHNRQKQK